jgi:polyisoprenoid-binding protein YceI
MSRSRAPLVVAVTLLAVVVGGVLVFQQFLAGDDVARLILPSATSAATPAVSSAAEASAEAGASAAAGATPTSSTGSGTAGSAAGLVGTWSVADGSVVGYRVREQLGGVSSLTDAVGRTSAVTGTATLEASGETVRVIAAAFEADLTALTSDNGRRDNRIRTVGLESDRFPTAAFVLVEAIEVPSGAISGETVAVTLGGDLTIHGVTKRVSIPAEARLNGDRIEVLGALAFPFSDFGMTPPDIAGFVEVGDDATLEVLLSLSKA